jgi:hypothetical protein
VGTTGKNKTKQNKTKQNKTKQEDDEKSPLHTQFKGPVLVPR